MIISTIKQFGLKLYADPEEIPFQYSANLEMRFIKDENYNDYTVVGYYIPPGENEAKLLSINDDGTFILGPDCFKQRGTLSFSFNLINSQEEVHLGSIDFEIRYAFGDSDTILPEPEEVWISLVTKVAKDAIKEDVALVKQKANEALQSASLANDKASEAKEYANNANQSAGSASLSASSALTAKNDAIAASNSAIQAKQDAEQSANNAKNSANTALENANKSTEAIETVTQIKTEIENKANDFDTNYQEKLKSFNDNATSKQNAFDNSVQTANTNLDNKVNQANSDLDAKVQEANTIIDEKVKTATEQAQKAKEEANRATQATDGKLDKNLGAENSDKVLITDAEGNVITQNKEDFEGGGTGNYNDLENKPQINGVELTGNKTSSDLKMYTQEEVDYLLADKMDKPYVPIEITDNATITDALEGNFKIDKIKGNTYQKVETDIVPTPDRPILIISKKVKAGDSYVELRSLKESKNLFDKNLLVQENSNSQKDSLAIQLKDKETYTISCSKNNVECILGVRARRKSDNLDAEIQLLSGTTEQGSFTVDYATYENYFIRIYQTAFNIIDTIQLELGSSATSYVPATVRDYKVVDHTNKTSKIVRNVGGVNLNDIKWNYGDRDLNHIRLYGSAPAPLKYVAQKTYCNIFESFYEKFNYSKQGIYCGNVSGGITISVMANSNVFSGHGQDEFDRLFKEYINNPNAITLYALKTPTEETIAYSADDTSEVGYSWQDNTSPSPTIKSEVQGVKKIDILKTGKNLIDGYDNFALLKSGTYYLSTNTLTTSSRIDFGLYDENKKLIREDIVTFTGSQFYLQANGTYRLSNNANSIKSKITFHDERVKFIKIIYIDIYVKFDEIQLEVGDIATAYEPYTRQHINITPPQPMYGNYDGSICDIADVESGNYDYYFKQKTGNTLNNISVQSVKSKTALIVIPKVNNGFPQTQFSCDCNMFESKAGSINGREDDEEFINSESSMYSIYINVKKDRLTTYDTAGAVEFITNSNMIISYPDTTPTTLPIPEDDLAKLKSLKTNAGVNNIFINGEVKPVVEARYPQDVVLAVNRLQTKLLTLQEEVVKNV